MSETTMTVRTGEQNAEALAKYYKTKSAGAIRAVEGFVQIRKYTLYELKGVFAREEINALKEAQNGIIILPEYQGNKRAKKLSHQKSFIFKRVLYNKVFFIFLSNFLSYIFVKNYCTGFNI